MCGRFAQFTPPARLARAFGATLVDGTEDALSPSWNVAPTDEVAGIRPPRRRELERGLTTRMLDHYRWGLVPSWAKDPAMGNRLFNARAESVATTGAFRGAFAARRLVVPCDGFYEWHGGRSGGGGPRQAHYFRRADGDLMALAGLFEFWRPRSPTDDPPPWLATCTIITTAAGPDMVGIHDRMPVVLDGGALDTWLGDEADAQELQALLEPPGAGTLEHYQVGLRVGNVRNNDPSLIEPDPEQPLLSTPADGS